MERFILVSDIEKAFLQVELQIEDRDVCRFLWLKDISKPPSTDNLLVYRFRRVPFGIISSPWLLAATIEHHLTIEQTPLASAILRNIYVDNVLLGATDLEHAKNLYYTSRSLFSRASMNLRDWVSNSPHFNDFIRSIGEVPPPILKLLGIVWDTEQDNFHITVNPMDSSSTVTKRSILKYINAIFDPLGWISPSILDKKLFLQDLWKQQLQWDETLPSTVQSIWTSLNPIDIPPVTFVIPRIVSIDKTHRHELHIFCDASAKAYGAAAYLRVTSSSSTESFLLFSKGRVSPTETMTIPKLELTALVLGVRVYKFLQRELDIPLAQTILWTDSQCTLDWVKANRQVSVYVDNRVREIRTVPEAIIFAHIPTNENPADILSRGCSPTELRDSNLWWHGPSRLHSDDVLHDIQGHFSVKIVADPEPAFSAIDSSQLSTILSFGRFSSFDKLLNTILLVLLFIQRSLKRDSNSSFLSPFLKSTLDRSSARRLLFKLLQLESPPDEGLIRNLHLYLDSDGLWRSHGRIDNSSQSFDTCHPIYLPRNHPATELYILHIHTSLSHAGVNHCLSELRRMVWIPKARSKVKSVIRNSCCHCQRQNSLPYQLPDMPPLPNSRTVPSRPFSHIGVDYMGPFSVRNMVGSIVKNWVIIFTCMFSRAIHCEVVTSYNAEGFVQAFRRFISRRGKPVLINSDHGTQLVLCASTLQDRIFRDFCNRFDFTWTFNTEKAPWKGSHFERLIGIFKTSFRHSAGRQILDYQTFLTTVTEIEGVVNSRPLTYISEDVDFVPLRPCDFLINQACLAPYDLPLIDSTDDDYQPSSSSRDRLLRFWKLNQEVTNRFIDHWTNQYLLNLRENGSWKHQQSSSNPRTPCVGDIVLLESNNEAKAHWKLCKIVHVPPSSPVREATVRFHSYSRNEATDEFRTTVSELTRPISMLYPLEVTSTAATSTAELPSSAPLPTADARRSSRIAKLPAKSYVYFAFCILIISPVLSTSMGQCPVGSALSPAVHTAHCLMNSTSIHSLGTSLCWIQQTCLDSRPTDHFCRSSCDLCPIWSAFCTDYSGRYVQWTRENSQIVSSTLAEFHEDVCSWEPNPACSPSLTSRNCFNVMLLDHSTHRLTTSTIRITDFSDLDPPVCVGTGARFGSPSFCAVHQCTENGTQFCYFDQPGLHFLVGNAYDIPLRAYGHQLCQFYGHPSALPPASRCVNCSVVCVDGGIMIRSELISVTVEYCVGTTCEILNISSTNSINGWVIPIRNELTQWDHTVATSLWSNGIMVFQDEHKCQPTSFCQHIHCYFCWHYILHFRQCVSTWEGLVLAISFVFTLMIVIFLIRLFLTLYICGVLMARIVQLSLKLLRLPYHCLRYICRYRSPNTNSPTDAPRRRIRRRIRNLIQTSVVLLGLAQLPRVTTMDQSAHFDTRSSTCSHNSNDTYTCFTSTTHLFTLRSASSSVGLTLASSDHMPIGSITVRYTSLKYLCNLRHLYYTRNHFFEVHSVKRCALSGSCADKDRNCANLHSTAKLDEFDPAINNSPGYTYCSESSGCWVQGCGICTSACLFYRIIAVPRSSTLYQVFTCPSFRPVVDIKINSDTPSFSTNFKTSLQPGLYQTLSHNIAISLVSTSVPHTPLLGSAFIRNMDTGQTSLTQAAPAGQQEPGKIGQLQCRSRPEAVKFNCSFTPRVCQCRTTETKANCNCAEFDLDQIYSKSDQVLPLEHGGVILHPSANSVSAVFTHSTSFQLQLDIRDLQTTFTYDRNTCEGSASALVGCHSCLSGARSNITCTTDFGSTLGLLRCGDNVFSVPCTPTGSTSVVVLQTNSSETDILCQLKCPASRSTLRITGQLLDLHPPEFFSESQAPSIIRNVTSTVAFGNFFGSLSLPSIITEYLSGYFTFVKYALCLLVALIVLYLLCQLRSLSFLLSLFRVVSFPKKQQ